MKNMKMLAAAALFACSITGAMAQQQTVTPEKKAEMRDQVKENMAKLDLTADQKKPYGEINRKYAEKLRALRDQDLPRADKMKAAKDLRDQKNAEVKALLTDTQYQTYLQIQEERTKRFIENKKG